MKKRAFAILLLAVLAVVPALAAQTGSAQPSEREVLNKAMQAADPAERIRALEQFVKEYPSSGSLGTVYSMLFNAYLTTAKNPLEYAEKAIDASAETTRPMICNNIAGSLAEQGVYLDKAYEYIKRGVETARRQNVPRRTLATVLNTMGWVEYKLGDYPSAESHMREAISNSSTQGDPMQQNPEYCARLGMILARSGAKLDEAADLLATSLILGEPKDADKTLEQVLKTVAPTDIPGKKGELFKRAGNQLIASASNKKSAQSRVAVSYARNGVLADEALSLAREAVDSLAPKSPIESVIDSNRTLGIVYALQKKYGQALAYFEKIAPLVRPYDSDFFLRWGQTLEGLGKNEEALNAYLNCAVAFQAPKIMEPLTALYKKIYGSDTGLKERISKLIEESAQLKPSGPPKVSKTGQVVLAELFTGSECSPCIASDLAFDGLLAGYDRKALAVLEYHLHIPGPDPMTNPDTEARAKFYAVSATPTVLLGGTDRLVGGGSKSASKYRFGVYSFGVDRKLESKPAVTISLDAAHDQSRVTVKASADAKDAAGDLKLRIALVEEVVHFTGGNGLSEHRAVVRQMIGTPVGIPLINGAASHSSVVELTAVSEGLKKYLDDFEKNPPDRHKLRKPPLLKEKKYEINPDNLSLVAFVQDDTTKEVLQASYLKLMK